MSDQHTNQQNIDAWSQFPQSEIEKFGDEGDFGRQHLLNPAIFELLGKVANKSIIDAGCGNGYMARKLAKLGVKVTAIEPADSLFEYAHKREQREPLGIEYIQQDLSTFHRPRIADVVVANMVFMDIPDFQAAMENCIEALKPGGQLIYSIAHPCFENSTEEFRQNGSIAIKEYLNEYAIQQTYGFKYHRPLSQYINLTIEYGCTVNKLIEPQLSRQIVEQYPNHLRGHHIPNYLIVNATKEI